MFEYTPLRDIVKWKRFLKLYIFSILFEKRIEFLGNTNARKKDVLLGLSYTNDKKRKTDNRVNYTHGRARLVILS